ncbi:Hypothetical predicted protein [Octopus vulgaris]|uniref:Uncharacterized protein n=1 Tax=Octopus vulgaris TaxID=6645 RepID=A0AA36FG11_OCTVU|nr:Hypothetical predicted protein [Octopus vulgaris]
MCQVCLRRCGAERAGSDKSSIVRRQHICGASYWTLFRMFNCTVTGPCEIRESVHKWESYAQLYKESVVMSDVKEANSFQLEVENVPQSGCTLLSSPVFTTSHQSQKNNQRIFNFKSRCSSLNASHLVFNIHEDSYRKCSSICISLNSYNSSFA